MATTLIKSALHQSVAASVLADIVNQSSKYYYYIGNVEPWINDLNPDQVSDSFEYELKSRNAIVTSKPIGASDVSLVIPRIDWTQGDTYDVYDDAYGTQLIGVNLYSGGVAYSTVPKAYVGSTGSIPWSPGSSFHIGDLVSDQGIYYACIDIPSSASAPADNAAFTAVPVNDGGGSGATIECSIIGSSIASIELLTPGFGYTSTPSITIVSNSGNGAKANAVIGKAASGALTLQDSKFYVVTDEFNVYKCLQNNNNQPSAFKPIGTDLNPMVAPDGYMWRFLYTIPVSLRLKFMTESYMPVSTALTAQFYSSGSLSTIKIDSMGTGYTSGSIVVSGNGFLASDPQYLTQVIVSLGGTGYTNQATATVDPPISFTVDWGPSTQVILGQAVQYNYNVYLVTKAGTTSSTPPTHRSGDVVNGTSTLSYAGSIPPVIPVVTDGVITDVTVLGMIRDIQLSEGGSGYLNSPIVTVSGSGTAIASTYLGRVTHITVTDPGQDYTAPPSVVIGTQWAATTAYSIGQQVAASSNLYTVTAAGTSGSTAPSHTSGSAVNGTVTFAYAGVAASASATLKYGSGYSSIPSITLSDIPAASGGQLSFRGTKSEAKLTPIFAGSYMGQPWTSNTAVTAGQLLYYGQNIYSAVSAGNTGSIPPTHTQGTTAGSPTSVQLKYYSTFGQLVQVHVDDGGVGYSSVSLTVTGDGQGAEISADLNVGNVNTLQANNELLTVAGKLMNIQPISTGWGYNGAVITIDGDGTGATAEAIISNGSIIGYTVLTPGSGYHWATISVSGNGFGASARAIIPPPGGHGKHAIQELFAHTLMMYTNVSNELNQGFSIDNDMRQVGIIKNPTAYNGTNILSIPIASTCWAVGASIIPAQFPPDSLVTDIQTGFRYRIVSVTSTGALLQSIDQGELQVGSSLVNASNNIMFVSSVTPPSMDKFSGDLLYIDNNPPFTPTPDQAVILTTIIEF